MDKIAAIITSIDSKDIESEYAIIAKKQPFLMSLLIGYQMDLAPEEFMEVNKLILIVWEYFKRDQKAKNNKITLQQFEKIQRKNSHLLKYLEQDDDQLKTIESDLEHLDSKDLFTGLLFRFKTQNTLSNMSTENKSIIMIGMKTIIECFEETKVQ